MAQVTLSKDTKRRRAFVGVDNWVMVDFPHVMRQLGVDPFDGHGWEDYDAGRKVPPRPAAAG